MRTRKTRTPKDRSADRRNDPPDIQATDDLMGKLLQVPKKELDARIAADKAKHRPA